MINLKFNNNPPSFSGTKQFFKFLYTIWIVVAFYTVFYGLMQAYVACLAVAIGTFILSPLNIYFEKLKFRQTSRHLFLLSCNFYIYVTSLGFGHSVRIEYYFLPAILIPIVVFDSTDRKNIFFGALIPIFCWVLTQYAGAEFIPQEWIFTPQSPNLFITINFLGAYSIGGVFMLIFANTINEQKSSLITSAKMSSLGEMASGIAHEINNPLSVILMKSLQIKSHLNKENINKDQIIEELIKIENTTKRIAKIIKGLKSFSRNSDKDPLQKVNVNDIINDTLELCSEKLKSKSINLEKNTSFNPTISCQPIQISQVFMNLVQNSIDAIEKHELPWIKITTQQDSDKVKIYFTDSGLGISDDVVEKMMQPFYTTKDIGKGTGLGLSITKGIIEDHNGEFYYDKTNPNTTFVVTLPIAIESKQMAIEGK